MAIFLDNLPVNLSEDIVLNADIEEKCRVVYRQHDDNGMNDSDAGERRTNTDDAGGISDYCFYDLWNPDTEYDDRCIIVPLRTTGVENVGFTPSAFSNMIGSKDDKNNDKNHPNVSWVMLLELNGIPVHSCGMDGRFYNPRDNRSLDDIFDDHGNLQKHFSCGGIIVGGRVCKEKENRKTASEVYLFPICTHHNVYSAVKGGGTGTGFYMKIGNVRRALKLQGYLRSAVVMSAISEQKARTD